MRYAHYINKQHGWTGHLWQGRFFSSALDEVSDSFIDKLEQKTNRVLRYRPQGRPTKKVASTFRN